MVVLLIIATLGVIWLGYLVMCRIDNFLEKNVALDIPRASANLGILVYGAPNAAEKINRAGLKSSVLDTTTFPAAGNYSVLLALSEDDCKNLALCQAAKHADPDITVIARCNIPYLHSAYEAAGADKLLDACESIDRLLIELRGIDR